MKDRKIIDMPDAREERLIRQALEQLAEEEIRAAKDDASLEEGAQAMTAAVQRHMARSEKPEHSGARRSLRVAVILAAVLVTFSGVCLASPEVREHLFTLAYERWGRHGVLQLTYTGADETERPEYQPTVERDDPRWQKVHWMWCLHYYPMYLPEEYEGGTASITMPEEVGKLNEWNPDFINEAARTRFLEIDEGRICLSSKDKSQRNAINFVESGRLGATVSFESETNTVERREIDGKNVTIVYAGSSVRCYWQQDDHMLKFSGPQEVLTMEEIEKVIANVERIR